MQDAKLNYYHIIANNLKKLRVSTKYSQEEFAEKIGCSREYVSRLENYKENISLQLLLHVAELFDKSPKDFFENT